MSVIVDAYGNPLSAQALRRSLDEPQTAQMAQLKNEFSNHPSNNLTPPRLAAILREAETGNLQAQCELFDDMEDRDGHLLSEMVKRRNALVIPDWDVLEPRDATAAEKKQTELARELLRAIPDFEIVVFDMLDAIGKGFSCLEIEWIRLGTMWLPKAITYRPASWFQLDPATRSVLRLRDGTVEGVPLQPMGWLVHTHRAKSGYAARGGLYRTLTWPYLFKSYSFRDLAEFLEIYGLPLRLGKYQAGATENDKNTLLRAVVELGHNAAAIIPASMEVDFKEAAKGTHEPFMAMSDACDRIMSKAILGGTLTSQADGKSSTNALGEVHNEVRHDLMRSDARQAASTLNRLIYMLLSLNSREPVDPRRCPSFFFDTAQPEDVTTYADALPKLVGIGVNDIPLDWVHQVLRIPKAQEGEAVLQVATTTPAPVAALTQRLPAPAPVGTHLSALKSEIPTPDADPLGLYAEGLASEWEAVMTPVVDPIRQLLAQCSTLEEFQARLSEVVPTQNVDPLVDTLTRATFAADLAGRTGLV
ncbi:MAG TPA: DUF935 domain-containing protein [Pseudomonas sp.]|uniref:DUF935 domain-containing protein n=1 Tax=Pseudomonas sp. TaxID=306 RepID=UPI002C5D18F6|nr:DUF935 domain-containing protein [Pseudomonas sp.]HWH86344.1 DUF935 domain-containing protein [Pseudomonas sp.]